MRLIRFRVLAYLGKIIYLVSVKILRSSGSALPGRVLEVIYPNFIKELFNYQNFQHRIIVTGTNGKTTTTKLIVHGLNKIEDSPVFTNKTGSNLPRGIISQYLSDINWRLELSAKIAVLEIDEGMLEQLIDEIKPNSIIILNIFRDQLDRFGEANNVFMRIKQKLDNYLSNNIDDSPQVFLNADDPIVARINEKALFFGVDITTENNHIDSEPSSLDYDYDLVSRESLLYHSYTVAHLGDYYLKSGNWKRPKRKYVLGVKSNGEMYFNFINQQIRFDSNLVGNYNLYNQSAALSLLCTFLTSDQMTTVFSDFQSAFGRQEIIRTGDNKVYLNLAKNPVGMVECLNLLQYQNPDFIIFILNDRYADGEDISWIWDVDLSNLFFYLQKTNISKHKNRQNKIYVFGDRKHDMGLRLYYSGIQYSIIHKNVLETIKEFNSATFSIMTTYTGMLDFRRELANNKIVKGKLV